MSCPAFCIIVCVWQAEHVALEQPLSQLWSTVIVVSLNQLRWMGSTHGGGMCAYKLLPPPTNYWKLKKKNTHIFVDMMLSNVLCDMPFSDTQPLKLADD